MQPPDYQVVKVKPDDLESALNQMSRQGWDFHTILRAESAGRSFWGPRRDGVPRRIPSPDLRAGV